MKDDCATGTDCTDSDRQCCRDERKTERTLAWRGENCVLVAAYSDRTSCHILCMEISSLNMYLNMRD